MVDLNGRKHLLHSTAESHSVKVSQCRRLIEPAFASASSSSRDDVVSFSVVAREMSLSRDVARREDPSITDDEDAEFVSSSGGGRSSLLSPATAGESCEFMSSKGIPETDGHAFFNFVRDQTRSLMIDVLNVSPFVVDEIAKVLRLIGTDPDITLLYDTVTCSKQWRLAVSRFEEPMIEHTVFGIMTYVMHCPLDRIVYNVLAGQSLTVFYDSYKNWTSEKRLNALSRVVTYVEAVRKCARAMTSGTRRTVSDEARTFVRDTWRCLSDNVHIVVREGVRALLKDFDVDSLGRLLRADLMIVAETLDRLLAVLREAQQRAVTEEGSYGDGQRASPIADGGDRVSRLTKERRSGRTRERRDVARK